MKPINLKGKRFGKWTVIEKAERPITNSPSKPLYWLCKCDCGNERVIPAHNLRCKKTMSCGHDSNLPDYKSLYNRFIYTNKDRVECNLTFEDFVKFTEIDTCHYCHSKIKWTKHGLPGSYNLDRTDNTKGYDKDNCVVCCGRCNFGKGNRYSYDEWFKMNECFRNEKTQL